MSTKDPTAIAAQATSLYRFYDARGVLLYIGITNSLPRRFGQHGEQKSWYSEAARVTIEHFATRELALEAERLAIKAERPLHNIRHNAQAPQATDEQLTGRWTYMTRSGYRRQEDMFLYPELECSSMVDDYYDQSGDVQFEEWVRYLVRHYPELLRDDAVPIYWTVLPACESAPPFIKGHYDGMISDDNRHFLAHFTWPTNAVTGDRLDWFSLPVVNDRFPEFAEALAWTPSPFQPYCPLRSILIARGMSYLLKPP